MVTSRITEEEKKPCNFKSPLCWSVFVKLVSWPLNH